MGEFKAEQRSRCAAQEGGLVRIAGQLSIQRPQQKPGQVQPLLRTRSIVYPPTIDWHYLYQRPQQLMAALARLGYRVYFCNAALNRRGSGGMRRLAANLFLVSGDEPGPAAGLDPILWISYPPHVRRLGRYHPGLVVFDAVDEPAEEFAHWAEDVAELRARADVIFASSRALYAAHAGRHPEVHLCPNAADFAHFAQATQAGSVPGDLARIPKPIIGYHGALANWIEWDLVEAVAKANPDLSFVFIGPLFSGGENLPSGPNLHFLGHRDYRLLPSYLRGFDLGIIPFRLSQMTKACNPIKLWEYLAAGLPVAGTPLPEVTALQAVHVGQGVDGFTLAIRSALLDRDPAAVRLRQTLARQNSWDERAHQIGRVLSRLGARDRR